MTFYFTGERCYTPLRQIGFCRPFNQCQSLLKLFSYSRSQSTINLLIQSQQNCGNRNFKGDPLLCCTDIVGKNILEPSSTANPYQQPSTTVAPSPSTAAPTISTEPLAENRQIDECYGPDNVLGTCIC